MASKHAFPRPARVTRGIRPAPIPIAIRTAVVAGALALGGAPAFAQDCTTDVTAAQCDGSRLAPAHHLHDPALAVGPAPAAVTAGDPAGNTLAQAASIVVVNRDVIEEAGEGDVTGLPAAYAGADLRVVNRGSIAATSYAGTATGLYAAADTLEVVNAGGIEADGLGGAVGIQAVGDNTVAVRNAEAGHIAALARSYDPYAGAAHAYGIAASGDDVEIRNRGLIEATGHGYTDGIVAYGADGVEIVNAGRIQARSNNAIEHVTPEVSGITARSGGDIRIATREDSVLDLGDAPWMWGIRGNAGGDGAVDIGNAGEIALVDDFDGSLDYMHGGAYGIYAGAEAGDIRIASSGDIAADIAIESAYGILALGGSGDIDIRHTGNIDLYTGGLDSSLLLRGATGLFAAGQGRLRAVNRGSISAATGGGVALGMGARMAGDVWMRNHGTIVADGGGYDAYTGQTALGMFAIASGGDVDVGNTDSLAVTANGFGNAEGIYATAGSDNGARVSNAGSIDAIATGTPRGDVTADAFGIRASAGDEVEVVNRAGGSIYASGYSSTGIQAAGDVATVRNAGGILVQAREGLPYAYNIGTGIVAAGDALASVRSTGTVAASGYYYATAIEAVADSVEGGVRIRNSGIVSAASTSSDYDRVEAIDAHGASVEVRNTGSIDAGGHRSATGIRASGVDVLVRNAGTVAASGLPGEAEHVGAASGISVAGSADGGIDIATVKDSAIVVAALPHAAGIRASGAGDVRIDNAGGIDLSDEFDPDSGLHWRAGGSAGIDAASDVEGASIDIHNRGRIGTDMVIYGSEGITATALGGPASSVEIVNDGSIDVYTQGRHVSIFSPGGAYGIDARSHGDATVVNRGDIAVGIGEGAVGGIRVATGTGDAVIRNEGSIALAGARQYAYYSYLYDNIGIHAVSDEGDVRIDNSGQVGVVAPVSLNAIGIHAEAASATITNTGSIRTYARDDASVGIATAGDVLTVVNRGDIEAVTGTTDAYAAIGVQMQATSAASFNNTGSIVATTANGVGSGVAVLIDSGGTLDFTNTGILQGAVVTSSGDDSFTAAPGSVWTIARQTTKLGAGADRIHNVAQAVLELSDGGIDLGAGANRFRNDGRLLVRGDSRIRMRQAVDGDVRATRHGSTRDGAMPLVNNGVIDLAGAATDDRLTIAGDLAGRGTVRLDGVGADMLRVEGSVRRGAVQVVDVVFEGFGSLARGGTDFAAVRGDADADAFVGGEVLGFEPGNFVALGVDVRSRIDADNRNDDVFSASVQARGLDDSGRLAASVGASVQGLLASQIGSWRQRADVLPPQPRGQGMTAFVRSFGAEGGALQARAGGDGLAGRYALGQRNAGRELGLQYRPSAGFAVGVLVGASEAQQRLAGAAHGTSWMQADTLGMSGTWTTPAGWYVDGSVWRMDFASRLDAPGSHQDPRGRAQAVNLESGYGFPLAGGLHVEPWLQSTWIRVDGLSLRGSQAEFRAHAATWRRDVLGLRAWKAVRDGRGVLWMPYGSASLVHLDDGGAGYSVSDVFNGSTSVGGTSTLFELGTRMQRRGFAADVGINWTGGGAVEPFLGGQLRLGYAW